MKVMNTNFSDYIATNRRIERLSGGDLSRQDLENFRNRNQTFRDLKHKIDQIERRTPEENKPLLDSRIAVELNASNENRFFSVTQFQGDLPDRLPDNPKLRGKLTDVSV